MGMKMARLIAPLNDFPPPPIVHNDVAVGTTFLVCRPTDRHMYGGLIRDKAINDETVAVRLRRGDASTGWWIKIDSLKLFDACPLVEVIAGVHDAIR